jgi:hypothetical protein
MKEGRKEGRKDEKEGGRKGKREGRRKEKEISIPVLEPFFPFRFPVSTFSPSIYLWLMYTSALQGLF